VNSQNVLYGNISENGNGQHNYDIWFFWTAIELTPGGVSTVNIYTQTVHRTTQLTNQNDTINNNNNTINHLIWKSAGRAPSLRVIPWHLPYNWGKSTEKPQSW